MQGRVECSPHPGKDYTILIDYAHTPDSMVNVANGEGICQGPHRGGVSAAAATVTDQAPRMGKAAADWSDFAVVTTDNPRTERTAAIIRHSAGALTAATPPYEVVETGWRPSAGLMDHAQKDDVIVLCGKATRPIRK